MKLFRRLLPDKMLEVPAGVMSRRLCFLDIGARGGYSGLGIK